MREITEHKIKIYEFPETDDEEENKIVKKIKVWFLPMRSCAHTYTLLLFSTQEMELNRRKKLDLTNKHEHASLSLS